MKQDTDWEIVSTSYDPVTLYRFLEQTVLAQTENKYPFSTVYDQELSFYLFKKESLSNPQWYERFNTKVDVGEVIGATRHHKVLLEYVAQESYTKSFTDLGAVEQKLVRDDAEEGYVSYAFCGKAERNMATSRWTFRMILPPDTIVIPRTANKLCIF
jgi:hypothetical protein